MKRILSSALALSLLLGTSGAALADSWRDNGNRNSQYHDRSDRHDNGRYDRGHKWRKGDRVDRREWQRWRRADWRRQQLPRPYRGHEWRQMDDGRFVQIAIATGIIILILNSR